MMSPRGCILFAALMLAAGPNLGAVDGRAQTGNYGFDASGMDATVKPGDNFNEFANGAWIKRTVIPGDHSYWGVWDILVEQSRTQVRDILESAVKSSAPLGSNLRKIGDYYASFMNETAIEQLGAMPLQRQFTAIDAIKNHQDLAAAFGHALHVGDSVPLTFSVFADLKRPDINVGYVAQGGLGLPDRDYYLQEDAHMADARAAYLVYARTLLRLSGRAPTDADAGERAKAVLGLEHRLAEIQWSQVKLRDVTARYVPWTLADYAKKAPGFAWDRYFRAAGGAGQSLAIASTDTAITSTAALVRSTPLRVWRDYLSIRAVDQHAPYLSKAFVSAHFAFHSTALQGTPDQEERWKRGSKFTEGAMGEAVGEIYVQRYFGAEAKASAQQLVVNLLAAAGRRIDASDWMSAATKSKAHEKLAAFHSKIGYPEKWRDYSRLAVGVGAYRNALAADEFEYQRNLEKLGQPVDRTEWDMTPTTVNAYYDPSKNEIVFPAAVLQPPFFDPNADPAVNYGAIGAIIGHEISHGFDDQGRLFDAQGALNNWWAAEDVTKYQKLTDQLVSQYSSYEVLPGLKLNGQLTLGENIADNAGIVLAFDAYHATLAGKPAPVIGGQSGDQRFFLGFAQDWRTIWRDLILRQLTATNPHAPDALRVRTVRNFDPWYAAFDVKPGQGLYLAPADRVRIW